MSAEVFIPLGHGRVAVIDFEDWDKIRPFTWHPQKGERNRTIYGVGCKRGQTNRMLHRIVWGEENIPDGFEIAHKDGDGLNCRRSTNLKCVTHAQNVQGKQAKKRGTDSRYRGVFWHERKSPWFAQLRHNGKAHYLGSFGDEADAAKAYDKKALELFGEHAALNFPLDNPDMT